MTTHCNIDLSAGGRADAFVTWEILQELADATDAHGMLGTLVQAADAAADHLIAEMLAPHLDPLRLPTIGEVEVAMCRLTKRQGRQFQKAFTARGVTRHLAEFARGCFVRTWARAAEEAHTRWTSISQAIPV